MSREASLRKAEQLLRDGKLEPAIEAYVRLIDQDPRDWAAINTLGDLYVRAGRPELAIAQFTRVADLLFAEGFLPKAQALYKKALKVQSGHEHTLRRLAEIATQQGLLADARHYRRQLGETETAADAPPPAGTVNAAVAPAPPMVVDTPPTVEPAPGVPAEQPPSVTPAYDTVADAESETIVVAVAEAGEASTAQEGVDDVLLEADLSEALGALDTPASADGGPAVAPPAAPAAVEPPRPKSLESVFAGIRTAATFQQPEMTASAHYELAARHLESSRWEDAIVELEIAARAPALRFQAGADLGRLLLRRGSVQSGIDWLERAAEAEAPDPVSRAAVMYELGLALEQTEEWARALAILLEIDAEMPRFRDVEGRVARLKRVVAGE